MQINRDNVKWAARFTAILLGVPRRHAGYDTRAPASPLGGYHPRFHSCARLGIRHHAYGQVSEERAFVSAVEPTSGSKDAGKHRVPWAPGLVRHLHPLLGSFEDYLVDREVGIVGLQGHLDLVAINGAFEAIVRVAPVDCEKTLLPSTLPLLILFVSSRAVTVPVSTAPSCLRT